MIGSTPSSRRSRVVALDDHATDVVRRLATRHLGNARFLTRRPGAPIADRDGADVGLATVNGEPVHLDEELDDADMVVLVASTDAGAAMASAIGEAATRRGIMTSGLVLGDGRSAGAAIQALRPHARVLLRSSDEDDLPDVLAALRA